MAHEAHVRIDEGIKRGKRLPRKQVDRRPKAALSGYHHVMPRVDEQRRAAILADCHAALQHGETTDQIGARYGISGRAVRYWLLDDPQAEAARRQLINGELVRTLDEMREAKHALTSLPLACARAEFDAWSWIAERREARLYGPKQEVTHVGPPPVLIIHAPIAAPAALPEKLIESVPDPDL